MLSGGTLIVIDPQERFLTANNISGATPFYTTRRSIFIPFGLVHKRKHPPIVYSLHIVNSLLSYTRILKEELKHAES